MSDWLAADRFKQHHESVGAALATAIEGVEDPAEDEVDVLDVATRAVLWRSTEHGYA